LGRIKDAIAYSISLGSISRCKTSSVSIFFPSKAKCASEPNLVVKVADKRLLDRGFACVIASTAIYGQLKVKARKWENAAVS
jgi:hypothetical protein